MLADFAQLSARPVAVLIINPADSRNARLFVGGLAPVGPLASVIQVSVETRSMNIASDLDWKPVPSGIVTVTEDSPAPSQPNAALWSGSIVFAKTPKPGQFRIVIREFENIAADAASTKLDRPPCHRRSVLFMRRSWRTTIHKPWRRSGNYGHR